MREHGKEAGAAAGAAALDRSGRYLQDARGLGDRVALHVDEHEGGALVHRKSGEGGEQLTMKIVTLGGGFCRLVRLQELLQALRVVDG
jgi:hypothetical protein